ncbi:MAG: efflux RND transporter periplasmic adaptor subunit [Planctomycetota bacterium]
MSDSDQARGRAERTSTPAGCDERAGHPRLRHVVKRVLLVALAAGCLWIGVAYSEAISSGAARALRWAGLAKGEPGVAETQPGERGEYYTCGMHPWVLLPEPGDCPICHMELTPISAAEFTGEVRIDPVVVQNMGVRVQPVTRGSLTRTIRTVGTIDYREPDVRDINVKVSGWIEKLHVDHVGAPVAAGDVLFELYAPELYAAQEEYLLAWRNRDRGPEQAALLDAARTRLEYYDVTDEQIAALRRRGAPSKTLAIHSPYDGVVIDKHAREGMKVDPGMRAFRIADLSRVWVMVTLYEYQLPYVSEGLRAVMSLPYLPGQRFTGEVVYVYPTVNRQTREARVRLEFDNPTGLLKPGMFAEVTLHNTLARKRTLAPRSAILDTGRRQVAFVWKGRGRFEPRDVTIGVQAEDGRVEILDGIKPGEQVVTSGQFLLDSEARLREARAKMVTEGLASEKTAVSQPSGQPTAGRLPEPARAALADALEAYFTVSDKLARDTIEDLSAPAQRLVEALERLMGVDVPGRPHFWHAHEEVATARGAALELTRAADLAEARLDFADLSTALRKLVRATGVPQRLDAEVHALHCPMYRQDQGGTIWLSPTETVRNPYYGSRMPGCFDARYALPTMPGAATQPAEQGAPTERGTRPHTPPETDPASGRGG